MIPPRLNLFECSRLRAKITERQCEINRNGYRSKGINVAPITSCRGCVGLGESAQVSLPVQEESVKKKKIECGRSGCGYGVKKEGDFCKKHQEPVVIPAEKQQRGLDDGPTLPRQATFCTTEPLHFCIAGMLDHACGAPAIMGTQSTTDWDDVTCEHCLIWKPEPATKDELATVRENRTAETDHLAGADKLINEPVVCLECHGPVTGLDLFCRDCGPQIAHIAADPPQDQANPCTILSPALAALVLTPEPPLPDTAVVLNLDPDMFDELVDAGVGTDTIIELLHLLFVSKEYRLVRSGGS